MTEKKLQIDLSPLWDNPQGIFIVRFNDMNEAKKTLLAMRIKKCARQYTLRKPDGPTVNTIHQALAEINPIIFSESMNERRSPWQNFNVYVTSKISGYIFHNLCQAIYLLTCIKKQPTQEQILGIARLSCRDWTRTEYFVENWFRNRNTETREGERLTPITNIGINDITEARVQAERNNNTHRRFDFAFAPITQIPTEVNTYAVDEFIRDPDVRRVVNEIIHPHITEQEQNNNDNNNL